MKLLDRYILRQYLINFTILLVVLMSMFIVIDLIVNIDEFLGAGDVYARQVLARQVAGEHHVDAALMERAATEDWSKDTIADEFGVSYETATVMQDGLQPSWQLYLRSTLYKIADYYAPMTLLLFVFLSGILTLGALGFTFFAMVRARELTAILASGVSMYRVAAPVIVAGIAINALALPIQELLVPPLAPKLARGPSDVRYDTVDSFSVYLAADQTNHILLSAGDFDAGQKEMRNVTILERDEHGVATRRVTARKARWNEPQGGWDLVEEGGWGISLKQADLEQPADAAPEHLKFYKTELSPTVILSRQAAIYSRLLPVTKLQEMQNNAAIDVRQRARVTQIIWGRFTMLLVNALVLVMALRFFLLRSPGNLLWESLKACVLCLGAWGGSLVALQMPNAFLNPVAAAWLPVLVLLPVATWHLVKLET